MVAYEVTQTYKKLVFASSFFHLTQLPGILYRVPEPDSAKKAPPVFGVIDATHLPPLLRCELLVRSGSLYSSVLSLGK